MKSDDCLKILARHHSDQIVVAAYHAAFIWMVIKPGPLNFYAIGAMGQGVSHGLGHALGDPNRQVIVLDGDGSLLMNLGALVTVGAVAPKNLVHFLCENGSYQVNGEHPLPGAGQVDFAAMARAAGYRHVHEIDALDRFEDNIASILAADGPTFVDLKLERGEDYPLDYQAMYDPAQRQAMKQELARQRTRTT